MSELKDALDKIWPGRWDVRDTYATRNLRGSYKVTIRSEKTRAGRVKWEGKICMSSYYAPLICRKSTYDRDETIRAMRTRWKILLGALVEIENL